MNRADIRWLQSIFVITYVVLLCLSVFKNICWNKWFLCVSWKVFQMEFFIFQAKIFALFTGTSKERRLEPRDYWDSLLLNIFCKSNNLRSSKYKIIEKIIWTTMKIHGAFAKKLILTCQFQILINFILNQKKLGINRNQSCILCGC